MTLSSFPYLEPGPPGRQKRRGSPLTPSPAHPSRSSSGGPRAFWLSKGALSPARGSAVARTTRKAALSIARIRSARFRVLRVEGGRAVRSRYPRYRAEAVRAIETRRLAGLSWLSRDRAHLEAGGSFEACFPDLRIAATGGSRKFGRQGPSHPWRKLAATARAANLNTAAKTGMDLSDVCATTLMSWWTRARSSALYRGPRSGRAGSASSRPTSPSCWRTSPRWWC